MARLDQVLHDLCDAIVDRPTAAIGIEVTDDGTRLVHRGHDRIAVDLTDGTFVAIAFTGRHHEEARSAGAIDGARRPPGTGVERPDPDR